MAPERCSDDSPDREIADLLAVVERDLADSATHQVSADWRMNIPYNAALQPRPQRWQRPATERHSISITTG